MKLPPVLWRCWLDGRKGIWPVKNWVVGCCLVICLEWGADLYMAQLMPLPLAVSCFSKIQIGFTFLVPAHPGSPGQTAVKRVCACVVIMCERDVICKTKKYLCMTHCNVTREGLNQGHGSRVPNISQSLDMQFCDTRVDRQTDRHKHADCNISHPCMDRS